MTLICSWFNLAFSTLVTSQVVLSAVLQPTDDVINTYTYVNDGSLILNNDPLNSKNIHEDNWSVKQNDKMISDEKSDNETQDGSVGHDDDEQSSEETGSLLHQLFSFINGGSQESEPIKNHKKRDYPQDIYEEEPDYYEDSRQWKRESKINRHYGHAPQSRPLSNNRLQYPEDFDEDEEELEDVFDEESDHDDIDFDHDHELHEHEVVEHIDDDHEIRDLEPEKDVQETLMDTKHMKEYRKKLPKHIEQGLIDVDDETLLAFSKFLENVMTVQMKNATRSNNNISKSVIDNKKPIHSSHGKARVNDKTSSTKPIGKLSSDTKTNNKNNENVETHLETEIQHDHEGTGSESRKARNVVMQGEPDISAIFDQFNIRDNEDERVFRHTRNENPTSKNENEVCDKLFHAYYDDFINHHENCGQKVPFDYMTNHQDYNFGYHYPSIKCWEKPYGTKCKNKPPIIMFKVEKINNDCNMDECGRNFRNPYYNNLDYTPVVAPGLPVVAPGMHGPAPGMHGPAPGMHGIVATKYKRDLEHVEKLDTKVNETNEEVIETNEKINEPQEFTTENNVMIANEFHPHEREIVYESVNLHTVPILAFDTEQREPSTEIYKFNDIYEHSEPLKKQIEMIPNDVITYLMTNVMNKVPMHKTNSSEETGMVINVYNDDVPKVVQKRDLNHRNIQCIEDCNNVGTSTNALTSIEYLIANQLARCPDLTNNNLTESDRRELCKNIVVKVLSNISDEHVIHEIVENYECRNCEPGCDGNSLPCCYGETNDDFEKTFINIKNLNIFYEFGESGQNCINMPNKRVQYTVPKHAANPNTRRLCPPRGKFPDHLQNNLVIGTTHSNREHQITFLQPPPTPQPNTINDKVPEDVKPLKDDIKHTRIDLHDNDVTDDKIAYKREHKITENENQNITENTDANKEIEMHPYTVENNRIYAHHNVKPLIAEEPEIVDLDPKSVDEEHIIHKHPEETTPVIHSKQQPEEVVSKPQDVTEEKSSHVSDKEISEMNNDDNKNIENTTESTNNAVNDTEIKEDKLVVEKNQEPVVVPEEVVVKEAEKPKEELKDETVAKHNEIKTDELVKDSVIEPELKLVPETHNDHNVVNDDKVSDDEILQNPIEEEKINLTNNEEHHTEELTQKSSVDFSQPIALILNKGTEINEETTHQENSHITPETETLEHDTKDVKETEIVSHHEDNHLVNPLSNTESELNNEDNTKQGSETTKETKVSKEEKENVLEAESLKNIHKDEISGNALNDDSILESKTEEHKLDNNLNSEEVIINKEDKLNEDKIEYEHQDNSQEEEVTNKSIESKEVKTLRDIGSLKEITHNENIEERDQDKREITNDEESKPSNGKYQSLIYKSETDESEEKLDSQLNDDSKVDETNKDSELDNRDMRSEEIGEISESDDNNSSHNNDDYDYLDDNRFCTADYSDIEGNDNQIDNIEIKEKETKTESEDESTTYEREEQIGKEIIDEDGDPNREDASRPIGGRTEDGSENEETSVDDEQQTRDQGEDDSPNNDEIQVVDDKEEPQEEARDGNVLTDNEPEDQFSTEETNDEENETKGDELIEQKVQVEIENTPEDTENENNETLDNTESNKNESTEEIVSYDKEISRDEQTIDIPIENNEETQEEKIEDIEKEDVVSESDNLEKQNFEETEAEPMSSDHKHTDDGDSEEEHTDLNEEKKDDDTADIESPVIAEKEIIQEDKERSQKEEDIKVIDIEEYHGRDKQGSKRNIDEVTNDLDVDHLSKNHNMELTQSPKHIDDDLLGHGNNALETCEKEQCHLGEEDAEYVKKCDVEKLIMEILESKPHPEHNIRHKNMLLDRHSKPDKKYQELVKDIASYFAKKNITSGDDICVYEEYGSKRGDDDVIILSGTKLYQNGVAKKDGQNFNLIIKKPHNSEIKPTAYDYLEYRTKNGKNKKGFEEIKKHKIPNTAQEDNLDNRPLMKRASYNKKVGSSKNL